jgi:PPOX class probable F420-dependent enzyme
MQINEGAAKRLREEAIIWLTTVRADGQPQPVPVWFLWDDRTFLIYSRPNQQKLRNIAHNPRVALNLNSDERGGHVLRIEGRAEIDRQAPPATEVAALVEKYREAIARIGMEPDSFARAYSVAIRVTPTRVSGG